MRRTLIVKLGVLVALLVVCMPAWAQERQGERQGGATYIPKEVVVLEEDGDVRVEESDATSLAGLKADAASYRDDSGVEAAGLNKLYEPDVAPDDPEWDWADQLRQFKAADGSPSYGGSWFYAAHEYATGGNLSVAVIDTGIDTTYRPRVNGQQSQEEGPEQPADLQLGDMVAQDFYTGDGSSSVYDTCRHGTSTAGQIFAATDNAEAGSGTSYDVQMNIAKASGSGTGCSLPTSAIADALIWASEVRGAEVINMSFGGIGSDPVMEAAVQRAQAAGSILVASVGNDGGVRHTNRFPVCYPDVIGVSATDKHNQFAADYPSIGSSGSSFGPCVDLSAKGVDNWVPIETPSPEQSVINYNGYYLQTGTSFSAPLVAGAALLVEDRLNGADGSLLVTNQQITDRLYNNAKDRGPTGYDEKYGHGQLWALCSVAPQHNAC